LFSAAIGTKLTPPHRNEFRKSLSVDKKDFAAIEFLLRKGRRQLEVYSSPGIRDVR
jgi:succinate dehydrogenase assembly factor 1